MVPYRYVDLCYRLCDAQNGLCELIHCGSTLESVYLLSNAAPSMIPLAGVHTLNELLRLSHLNVIRNNTLIEERPTIALYNQRILQGMYSEL